MSHIALQQSTIENTLEQIVEQPHILNFRSHNNQLLANDEPTSSIPQPLRLSIQSSTPRLSHFNFKPHLLPLPSFSFNSLRMDSTQTIFITTSILIQPMLKLPMNSSTPNPVQRIFPNRLFSP